MWIIHKCIKSRQQLTAWFKYKVYYCTRKKAPGKVFVLWLLHSKMSISKLPYTKTSYQFYFGGENGESCVSFSVIQDHLTCECTCGRSRGTDLCWHGQYVLAGKTARITGGDMNLQKELIKQAEETREGKRMVRQAAKKFEGESHCRRCNSDRIVKIKFSPAARLYTLFREVTHHTYFCKKCRWTW